MKPRDHGHHASTTLSPVTNFFRYLAFSLAALLAACEASNVAQVTAKLGQPVDKKTMLEAVVDGGPIEVKKWTAAHWEVPLRGVVNLKHPKAVAAKLDDRSEPINIFVYTLKHPTFGTFLIDSGVGEAFRDPNDYPHLSSLVTLAMNMDKFELVLSTKEVADLEGPIEGVFLTHIHLDHILGLSDLSEDTPVYIGPGDAASKHWPNLITRGSANRLLETQGTLREWDYSGGKLLDVFGDGSLFAIHSPGHTPGSTAYLIASTQGPQLMLGDITHTRWGWENGVEPGSFSADIPTSATSLRWLKALSREIPGVSVHPGHQHATSSL